ncbi:MAG TPA: hypothetical protein DCF68_18585 [Cyanothece sp. UBA12306]|nr:hypothetical protein [Cyanothece sp. UBA12306]
MLFVTIVLTVYAIIGFPLQDFFSKKNDLDYKELNQLCKILASETNTSQIVFICVFIVFFTLTVIILYLIWINLHLQRKLTDSYQEIKDTYTEISKRKKIHYEVFPDTDEVEERGFFKNKKYTLLGYKIQYFMDGVPFVESSFKKVYKLEKTELDSDRIKKLTHKAVQVGMQSMLAFESAGNPLAPITTDTVVRKLLPPSN